MDWKDINEELPTKSGDVLVRLECSCKKCKTYWVKHKVMFFDIRTKAFENNTYNKSNKFTVEKLNVYHYHKRQVKHFVYIDELEKKGIK